MALLRNGANLYGNNSRAFLAGGVYALASTFGGPGKRNWANGEHRVTDVTDKSGLPNGYRHPVAWLLPQKAGAITSRNEARARVDGSGVGAMGLGGVATTTITISGMAVGGLIAGGVGSATITISGSADIFAGIASAALATVSIDGAAAIAAVGHVLAVGTLSINGAVVPYARGHMQATTDFGNELSPNALADAVWQRVIEAGFSAEAVLRLIAAHAAGAATGLEGANPQFTGLDGSTLRIDGSYSAGTRTIDALDGS